jgi:uncharacterized protein (DUF1330 family)
MHRRIVPARLGGAVGGAAGSSRASSGPPGRRVAAAAHNARHTTKERPMAELHGVNPGLIASLPDSGPVVMVNLLRLRDREAYKRYSELAMPLIKARGGTVLWAGHGEAVAFGDPASDHWDYIVLVRYPSRAAFVDMVGSPDYAQANLLREQAVQRHVIVAACESYSKRVQT